MKEEKQIGFGVSIERTGGEEVTAMTIAAGPISLGLGGLDEQANYLHRISVESGKRSVAAAILAGWVLSRAKATISHGQWRNWMSARLNFHYTTAANYIALYEQTVGAARAAMHRPLPLDAEPTAAELEEAAHDVKERSLTSLYKEARIISRSSGWGGAREGAGAKAADDLPMVDEAEAARTIWARVLQALSAKAVADALPLLAEREAKVALETLGELTRALKAHLKSIEES